MRKLVIFGLGDIAKLAHYYFDQDSDHRVVAFTVDASHRRTDEFCSLPVVSFESVATMFAPRDHDLFVAVSYAQMNRLRATKCDEAARAGYRLATYTSSRATVMTTFVAGENCFILEGAIVQPFARIGRNVTIWSGAHVGHDSIIEDHCFLAPNVAISGNVRVREYSFLGVNSTVRNSVTVAPRTLVGAGAVILGDTDEGGVYAAPRARRLSMRSEEISP
ncbi:MAG TPA: acetyltransferase [Gemmatimonadaceae bacterium]|nr:acetyltransferase [Gemmatimonadaceae bacterium]